MALITPINLSRLEGGVKAYLEARFLADSVVVPVPAGEATVATAAPQVLCGLSVDKIAVTSPVVAVLARSAPAVVAGLYDQIRVEITVASPLLIDGISLEVHRALVDAVLACFPARPRPGAETEDLEDWEALEAELSAAVLAATGYEVHGWFVGGGRAGRGDDRVEQGITLTPGLVHPDVAGD